MFLEILREKDKECSYKVLEKNTLNILTKSWKNDTEYSYKVVEKMIKNVFTNSWRKR